MTRKKPDYDSYELVRKESTDTISQASLAYDKSIIALSSLLLGYIFLYTGHLNAKIEPVAVFVIFSSILFCLLSFWLDQLVSSSYIKIAEEYYVNGKQEYKCKLPLLYYPSLTIKILAGVAYLSGFIIFYIAQVS
jgi:hypothetical protein